MKNGGRSAPAQTAWSTSRARDYSSRCGTAPAIQSRASACRAVGAISVQNLAVSFGSAVALDDVTVSVPAESLTMIVGPPGGGKTVLMKSLSCELQWGSGRVWIQDVPARLWPSKKREVCLCTCPAAGGIPCPFSDPATCSLRESTGYVDSMTFVSGLREGLHLLGVEHLEKRCGPSLAERDRRRLELAFTLAPFLCGSEDRRVHLWLDDPLDAIDTLHQHRLLQWLKETARARQTTVVTATDHGMARLYADHAILLSGGKLIAEGPPKAALNSERLTQAFGDTMQRNWSPP